MTDLYRIRLPFQEQIEFFRQKLNLPTARWDDIWQQAHDRAFVVAGAMNADLLDDLRKAVDAAIAGGDTIADFRKKFDAIVQKHGWHGWTGEGTKAGEAWRTRTIYTTNIATSYAAGRWQQLTDPDLLKLRPYWRYIHNDSVLSPRPQHKAWGDSGLTLPHDHPFWQTHFPPNGWGCFPGDTLVRCDALIGQRFDYSGEMVEIETRLGYRLTITPNHPILTADGWFPAGEIEAGYQVLTTASSIDSVLVGVVNDPQPPSLAENLFQSLAAQGLRIIPMAPDDFHGDAAGGEGEVHIAGHDRSLMDVIDPESGELFAENMLFSALHGDIEPARVAQRTSLAAAVFSDSILAQNPADGRLGDAEPFGNAGLACQTGPVQGNDFPLDISVSGISRAPCAGEQAGGFSASLDINPPGFHAVTSPAHGDASKFQHASKGGSAKSEFYGQLFEANSGLIAQDEVVFVRKFNWSGHVYDFTTSTGLIVAGGIVVSNCRCRVTAVKGPQEGDATEPPAGWKTPDAKGNLPGIDKGWAYAPGRTWHPDLDKYPYDTARAMVAENMQDGVFERWHAKIAEQVQAEISRPEYSGIDKAAMIDRLRRSIASQEVYPVAVLPPEIVEKMRVGTQVVKLSSYDLVKQQISRAGQDFDALEYLKSQGALDNASLIVRENDQMVLFVSDVSGSWYAAVLQQTASGKAVFLKSFRRSSLKDARLQRKKGEVLIDALPN